MKSKDFAGDPIPLVSLSGLEKVVFGALNGISYALGYFVGIVRYRVFKKLNLFDVLSSMSRGLAAAAAAAEPRGTLESGNTGN